MKKSLILLVLLCLIFVFGACGQEPAAEPAPEQSEAQAPAEGEELPYYELTLASHISTQSVIWAELLTFAEAVEERTDGHITFNLFPDGALGDYIAVYGEVMNGTIDMAYTSQPTNYDERFSIINIPGLFTTYEEAKELLKPGHVFYDTLVQLNAEAGVKLLGMPLEGFDLVAFTCKDKPADYLDFTNPAAKPLIRVPSTGLWGLCAETLGYRTNAIPWSDVYTSLQTGIVDGLNGIQMNATIEYFRDLITYVADYRTMYGSAYLTINQELFDSMPAEYQAVLEEEGLKLTDNGCDASAGIDAEAIAYFANEGAEITQFTEEEMAIIMDQIQPVLIPEIAKLTGNDVLQPILDTHNIDITLE